MTRDTKEVHHKTRGALSGEAAVGVLQVTVQALTILA